MACVRPWGSDGMWALWRKSLHAFIMKSSKLMDCELQCYVHLKAH
jgi:hypothetical protein